MTPIDFKKLLPVVKALDALRFKSVLSTADWCELYLLQRQFAEITHGRQIPPKPFVSDGCTFSPDRFGVHCCELHDLAYWLGGDREDKARADAELKGCTCKQSEAYAPVQWLGVRVLGSRFMPDVSWIGPNGQWTKKRFRWGFGHEWPAPGELGVVY
jgi:hypothetical protein